MLKLPPPVWALIYLAIAGLASIAYPWRQLIDLRSIVPGTLLIAAGLAFSFWAALLFGREEQSSIPTSETTKKLVIRGPSRHTQSDVSGLVLSSLGNRDSRGIAAAVLRAGAGVRHRDWGHIRSRKQKCVASSARLRRLRGERAPLALTRSRVLAIAAGYCPAFVG